MKTIGICIPTYQRGEITKKSIMHIYQNNKDLFDEGICHFYISDDCSKDDTYNLLLNLKKEIKCITIKKNKINLGFEGNNGECVKMCEKDYAWMLGDDDTIDVKIEKVIKKIEKERVSPDFVIIGRDKHIEEKIYRDRNETIIKLIDESTWMFGLLYKRDVVKNLQFERYSLGEFPQTGAIFEYFGVHDSTVQYIYGPDYARILRPGVISYNDRILEIYAKGWTNLVMGLPLTYDYKIKMQIISNRKKSMSNLILMSLRSQDFFSPKLLKEYYPYLKLYNKSPYFILFLISVAPKNILIVARKLYSKITKTELTRNG